MTAFDLLALALLLVAGLNGLAKGGVREVVGLVAFALSALIAAYALPLSAPVARKLVQPDWLALAAAVGGVFLLVFFCLKAFTAIIVSQLHRSQGLGALDRTAGLAFGVGRALVILGLFELTLSAVAPGDAAPKWVTEAKLYPLARASGKLMGVVAPHGADLAKALEQQAVDKVSANVSAELNQRVSEASAHQAERVGLSIVPKASHLSNYDVQPHKSPPTKPAAYGPKMRHGIDDLVERTR
ncbi:MAG: CvpA family protein [Pseudomonadota bacterium]|jgi:membrane protein required for colicin V production